MILTEPISKAEVLTRVKRAIRRVTGKDTDDIDDHAKLDSFGLDSLASIELSVELQLQFRKFKLKIPDEKLSEPKTIPDVVEMVHSYVSLRSSNS